MFKIALALMLGSSFPIGLPNFCVCKKRCTSNHVKVCPNRFHKRTHDYLVKLLIELCKSANCLVSTDASEIQHLAVDKSNKVVDFKISNGEMNSKPTFVDVTIVNTLEDDRDIEYVATDRAENLKRKKHAYIENQNYGKFIPLAFGYGGNWGKAATKFINKIFKSVDKESFFSSKFHDINWSCERG